MKQRRSVVGLTFVMGLSILLGGCQESGRLRMVWRGISDDPQIWQSVADETAGGPDWAPQSRLPFEARTEDGPAVTAFSAVDMPRGDGLTHPPFETFYAWRGVGDDQGVYWTRSGQTGLGLAPASTGFGSSRGPALAAQPFQYIYMAWKGVAGDQGIYWSYNSLQHGLSGWEPQQKVPGVGTSERPALAYRRDHLCMAWKGVEGDSSIYVACNGGASTWEPQRRVPDVGTSRGPALAYFNGILHMVWKGAERDQGLYHASSGDDGFTWTKQEKLPGFGSNDSPALCAFGFDLIMAWKGIGGDSALYWSRSRDGSGWDDQHIVPNVGSYHGPSLTVE